MKYFKKYDFERGIIKRFYWWEEGFKFYSGGEG